jgi:putative membrane protein
MMWYGSGVYGWGWPLMLVSMLLFWAVLIAGIVVAVRFWPRPTSGQPPLGEAKRVLAERYARGEIDEDEYRRRLAVLESPNATGGTKPTA